MASTDWFAATGYGIGLHWTTESMPEAGGAPLDYRAAVDAFDVDLLARQLAEAGAGYVLFTISHAQQYFAFPSPALDRILPGRTCARDLYADLYDALAPLGIKLMFYYPSVGVHQDPRWQEASAWFADPARFARLQYELVAEVGQRYGSRLAGWWIDNCFDARPDYPPHQRGYGARYDYATYADALRAGNPTRIVAFSVSSIYEWDSTWVRDIQDYQAGEAQDLRRLPAVRYAGEGGAQWHTWIPMDDPEWAHTVGRPAPAPRWGDAEVVDYVGAVIAGEGVFTYNAAPYQDTLIADATMRQLRALGTSVRGQR